MEREKERKVDTPGFLFEGLSEGGGAVKGKGAPPLLKGKTLSI